MRSNQCYAQIDCDRSKAASSTFSGSELESYREYLFLEMCKELRIHFAEPLLREELLKSVGRSIASSKDFLGRLGFETFIAFISVS